MKVLGIVMIVIGVLGGAGMAAAPDPNDRSPAYRAGQTIGVLVWVGAGILLVRSADRQAAARQRELNEPDEGDVPYHRRKPRSGGNPWDQGA